jgi:hypothetical protein
MSLCHLVVRLNGPTHYPAVTRQGCSTFGGMGLDLDLTLGAEVR